MYFVLQIVYLARNPKDVVCSKAAFVLPILPPEKQDFKYFVKCCILNDQGTVSIYAWDHKKVLPLILNFEPL